MWGIMHLFKPHTTLKNLLSKMQEYLPSQIHYFLKCQDPRELPQDRTYFLWLCLLLCFWTQNWAQIIQTLGFNRKINLCSAACSASYKISKKWSIRITVSAEDIAHKLWPLILIKGFKKPSHFCVSHLPFVRQRSCWGADSPLRAPTANRILLFTTLIK